MLQTGAMGSGNDNQWFISPNTGCAQRQGTPIHGNMSAGKAVSHCDPGLAEYKGFKTCCNEDSLWLFQ